MLEDSEFASFVERPLETVDLLSPVDVSEYDLRREIGLLFLTADTSSVLKRKDFLRNLTQTRLLLN